MDIHQNIAMLSGIMMTNNCYTGIGSHETPDDILILMRRIGYIMAMKGVALRTGEADGADRAFYKGVVDANKIHRVKFKNEVFVADSPKEYHCVNDIVNIFSSDLMSTAPIQGFRETAVRIRGSWDNLSYFGAMRHIRNVAQVLGVDGNSPSRGMICWAKPVNPPKMTDTQIRYVEGETNTAYCTAILHNIPVYNLHDMEDRMYFEDWVNQELDKLSS
jgi:hypothetical protein